MTAPSNLLMAGNESFGAATVVVANGGASVTSFGNNAVAFTPTTTLPLK